MWRFLAGVASALLLVGGGLFWWRSGTAPAVTPGVLAAAGVANAAAPADEALPLPPAASEETREEARFNRYDKDKNGLITRDEFLANRRKAFARLDTNGDGKLSFEEYAVKTIDRFTRADADTSGTLDAKEFATTRVVRHSSRPKCPQVAAVAPAPPDGVTTAIRFLDSATLNERMRAGARPRSSLAGPPTSRAFGPARRNRRR